MKESYIEVNVKIVGWGEGLKLPVHYYRLRMKSS